MATLSDAWIQDIAADLNVPAVSPSVSQQLLPVVEMQIRKVIQQGHKFQKRGKGISLTGN